MVDYMDYNIMEVRSRRVDPSNIILEKSESTDFRDLSYFGEIHYITLFQLKHETGLSDDELFEISLTWWGKLGNAKTYHQAETNGYYDFYNVKVAVLRSAWKSNDMEYRTKRKYPNGEEKEFAEPWRGRNQPKIHNKDTKQTYKNSTKTNYGSCWVIGSEVVYDYGKLYDVGYDYKKKEVPLPVHAYRMDEIPLMQNCIMPEDQIMLTNIRLQNAIAKSPPPGLKIEYNALMGMTFGDDAEWKPMDMLKLYSQTGHMIFNITPDGVDLPPNYPDPISELKGGLGTAIQDASDSFQLQYSHLMTLTGIDPISSVSKSPTSAQGKAVTEIAVSATGNTLKPVYASYLSVKESLALGTILRIQGLVYTREDTPYVPIIGIPAVAALKAVGTKSPVQLGVHLIATPDDSLKQEVRAAAQAALAGGKNGIPALKYSEYLFIVESLTSTSGIQSARMYIAIKEAEREEADRANAEAAVQNQGKTVEAQLDKKAQADLDKLGKETEGAILKVQAEEKKEIAIENVRHANKMEQIKLDKALTPEKVGQD
jgi:hypothetical protein